MTSSLVGSEMCIRDRPRPLPHCLEANLKQQHKTATRDVKNTRRRLARPVSYTHLTLPTICSV
eukprot:4020590-Prorocentrum_lima.AAC.1